MITITNTMSGKKEHFKPLQPGKIKLYVCGVTPYDYSHIGHGRVYVTFDVLYRFLKLLGYSVTYCRNFTNIDDKILRRAKEELGDQSRYTEIAEKYIKAYHEDMKALGCLLPDYEPRVTDCIDDIITFVQGLVDAGKAYVVDGDVYFSIASFAEYGKLSKHKVEDLRAGERVEVSDKKRDPLDFALWKSESEGTFWKSPWGYGRPGWHIECSAMAAKYLGKQIDIHAGGLDLVFPHHENEIAQSEALHGVSMSNYWMHNGFVTVKQEKMSKSLGNFFTLREVFKQFDPMIIRFYILSHHYRTPMEFSFLDIQAFGKSYQRLCRTFDVECGEISDKEILESSQVQRMIEFLSDDLNTPGMFGVLFENLDVIKADQKELCIVKAFLTRIMGLPLQPIAAKEVELTPEIEQLMQEREQARKAKDWARADAIRDKLNELGVEIKDKKTK